MDDSRRFIYRVLVALWLLIFSSCGRWLCLLLEFGVGLECACPFARSVALRDETTLALAMCLHCSLYSWLLGKRKVFVLSLAWFVSRRFSFCHSEAFNLFLGMARPFRHILS